jgi:hypothetical protein
MNDLTAATAAEDDHLPPSTTPTDPTSSNREGWGPNDIIQPTYTVRSKRGPHGLDRKWLDGIALDSTAATSR